MIYESGCQTLVSLCWKATHQVISGT